MRRPLFIVCLCLVAAAALWLSLGEKPDSMESGQLPEAFYDGASITITGKVYQKEPGESKSQVFRVNSLEQSILSNAAASWQRIPINGKLICEIENADGICIGSTVMLQGTYKQFLSATNPGEFDAAKYYATQGICGRLTDVSVLGISNDYSVLQEALYQLRCCFKERIYQVFPEKEASILAAMLLGDKAGLDSEIKTRYMENGIIHILSISGLHITMLGMGLYKLLRRGGVPIWAAAFMGGAALVLYGIMTGMSVSACRAIGMYLIRMLAVCVGRTYDMLTALGVMAVFLIGQNPANLMNAGFLLSFGSILGIGLLYPALLPREERSVPKPIQSIAAGASITFFTLPIQLWFYYEVPTYSILINLLVLPFMSIVMATGLIAMLLPGFGLVGTVTCVILQGYEWLCDIFSKLPLHTWNPGKPELWQVIGFYCLLGVLIGIRSRKTHVIYKNNRRYVWMPILLTVSFIILGIRIPSGNTVTFLDVGQGDGIVVETASGEVFLFDCGSSSRKKIGEYVLLPFLKYRGIRYIDAVFVSHADTDHCSGIVELLEKGGAEGIGVGQLVLPAIAEDGRAEEFVNLLQAAMEDEIVISYMKAGDFFATEKASFVCLHPPGGYDAENSNACSLCFYAEFGGTEDFCGSLLLVGDVEGEGETLLLQELKKLGINHVSLLKVAHHGSRNSSTEELLEQINPKVAIISCGKDNSYGHPHEETLARLKGVGSSVLTTPDYGAITVEMDKGIRGYGFTK